MRYPTSEGPCQIVTCSCTTCFCSPQALSHLSSIGTTIQTCAQPPQRQKDPTPAQEVQHLSQQLSWATLWFYNINQHQPTSTIINQHQPTSTNINQQYEMGLSKRITRPPILSLCPCGNVLKPWHWDFWVPNFKTISLNLTAAECIAPRISRILESNFLSSA